MSREIFPSLVTTNWLADHLDDADLVLLDATFTLPGITPTAAEGFSIRHIPGAQFFDIDRIADQSNPLPHMLPSAEVFARMVEELGISNLHRVVIYDTPGLMSAGRAWWMFRIFGHQKIAILDGGLKKWLAEGRPVTDVVEKRQPGHYTPHLSKSGLRTKANLLSNLSSRTEQMIDARSAGRFNGVEKETRPGLRSGHIPGSLNIPFNLMTNADTGELKSSSELRLIFEQAGLDFSRPAIASCGSGVTACALAFALHQAGKDDVAIYDGSWSEWGLPGDTPVEPDPTNQNSS